MTVEIPLHNVTAADYNAILRHLYARRNWWWLAAIVVACLAVTVIDQRLMIAGLLTLLVVLPMAFALIYFYYGLTLESRFSVLEKTVTADDKGLRLDFTHEKMEAQQIAWQRFTRFTVEKKHIILHLDRPYQFLAIPLTAFNGDKDLLRDFASLAHSKISSK